MSTPFIKPQPSPHASATMIPTAIDWSSTLTISPKTATARTATEPTERSTNPDRTSIAPGTATRPTTATWRRTTDRLLRVKKWSLNEVKTMPRAMSAASSPPL